MVVAAHNNDLKAAQQNGLKTAFVARPTEYCPHQKYDFEAKGDWDIVATDLAGLPTGWGAVTRASEAPSRRSECFV